MKPDLKSKTFWLNLGMVLLATALAYIKTALPEAPDFVLGVSADGEPKAMDPATILLIVSSIANLVLRYFTKTPILPFWKG